MRQIGWIIGFVLAGWGQTAIAEAAMCEYSHPAHPSWGFFTSCESQTIEGVSGSTTRVTVANGSAFTTETQRAPDGAARHSVNGKAAEKLDRDGSACFRTVAERELVCIHAAGTPAPAASVAAAPATSPGGVAGFAPALGGGAPGYCLLTTETDGVAALIDSGACLRAENCQAGGDSAAASCVTLHVWKNGRETGLYKVDDWLALDGAPVEARDDGCYGEPDGGQVFCYSRTAFDQARIPALLAADLAPAPVAAPVAAAPIAASGPAQCRFLKAGVEIAQSDCTAQPACDGDACVVAYTLDTGASVTLTVIGGQARVIDGIATGPEPWSDGEAICLAYAATPFRFCYTPGSG